VSVKLGGLGMEMLGFDLVPPHPARSSQEIAEIYRPFIMTCIEAFGAGRCMFESNFPVDRSASSYSTLWNAFKRIAAPASPGEKTDLFAGTAQRVYRLGETSGADAGDRLHASAVAGPATGNGSAAVRFLRDYVHGGLPAVRERLADNFSWWTPRSGEISKRLEAIKAATARYYSAPPEFTVTGVTADGGRVAVEATSHATLTNGRVYHNTYHFLVQFDGNSVRAVREYSDTKHVSEVWDGLL
jgi:ketosteroid isomerase-like protein